MPAYRTSTAPGPSTTAAETRAWVLEQAALAEATTAEAFSPFDLIARCRKGPVRGLLKSTSFRAKLKKILADEDLEASICPEVIWASGMSMGAEIMDVMEGVLEEVRFRSNILGAFGLTLLVEPETPGEVGGNFN